MFKEDYVSFETAKLLKKKGFDEITFTWYTGKGKFCVGKNNFDDYHVNHLSNMASAIDKNKCSAPTLQMARKWLEDTKEHLVYSYPVYDGRKIKWRYNIWFDNSKMFLGQILEYGTDETFNTSQEAIESAIKYCLENLI